MTLQKFTQKYITNHSKEALLSLLKTTRAKQLDAFLNSSNIAEFLDKGLYDSKSSKEFIYDLAQILNYKDIDNEITAAKKEYDRAKSEDKRLNSAQITIYFENGASSFMDAMARSCVNKVEFDKTKLPNKNNEEVLTILQEIAKGHYRKNALQKSKWGAIKYYQLDLNGTTTTYNI